MMGLAGRCQSVMCRVARVACCMWHGKQACRSLRFYFAGGEENYFEAISYFEKAIARDPEFAHAYADLAISYFFLDAGKHEKLYAEEINTYSDNALLYDMQLPQSLRGTAQW